MQNGREAGFTYLGVLLLVAVTSIALSATMTVWHFEFQREKERELLFIGNEFRTALDRYAAATQRGGLGRRYPLRLEDLILDERFAAKRRHLRRIYKDPMTGNTDWGLVKTADGQIIGVHSLSSEKTIKRDNFLQRDIGLVGRTSYDQWIFMSSTARVAPAINQSVPRNN